MRYSRSATMKIINTEQLGAVARARRKHLKVTQKELAMTCGTGLRFIVDLEKGKPTCQIGKTLQGMTSADCSGRSSADRDSIVARSRRPPFAPYSATTLPLSAVRFHIVDLPAKVI